MAEISNPAPRIISRIEPTFPSFKIWGLIKHKVQLFKTAVVCIGLLSAFTLSPNQKLDSVL